ncbi:MAG: ZIP family metal transporter [Planctomycetota bacterium]
MPPAAWLALYSVLILAVSLLGGLLPALMAVTHKRLQLLGSVIAGFIIGTALLHMLPHAAMDLSPLALGAWTLAGLLTMYLVERFFTFHHHELAESAADPGHEHTHAFDHGDLETQNANLETTGSAPDTPQTQRGIAWLGVAIGLTLHSLLAGIALAAAIAAEPGAIPGLAVFLIIALHKPLDSLTLIGLMRHGKASRRAMHLANAAFALVVPLGAIGFYALASLTTGGIQADAAPALAFAAGVFLCIALSDLLPELHFHAHDRVKLSAALLLGVALATAVALAEHATHAGHDHGGHGDHSGHNHANHADDHHGHAH